MASAKKATRRLLSGDSTSRRKTRLKHGDFVHFESDDTGTFVHFYRPTADVPTGVPLMIETPGSNFPREFHSMGRVFQVQALAELIELLIGIPLVCEPKLEKSNVRYSLAVYRVWKPAKGPPPS